MEGRPKILLTNFHLGTGGGHRTYLLSLLKSPLARQFDLALACPATSSINILARENGNTVFDHYFPGSLKDFFQVVASVRNLERIHRQFPFDIIHCNGSRDHWIAIYWKTFYRRAAKIVRSRHAVKKIGNDFVHAWAYNRATALNIFVSHGMIPLCEPPGKLKLENARVIPNGIDTEHFQPRKRDVDLAARLGIGDSDFVIGSNAGLGTHKRADLMLQAAAGLSSRDHLKILLLGEKRAAGNCLQLARQLGLEKNLVCEGMVDDVRPYLSLMDLGFVLSESIETSSYAAKEMMAMGIPLVCSRYSGLPENIDEGKNGFLVAPGDIENLRKCVTVFLNLSPSEKAAFHAHSRDKAVREFSRQRQMESLAQAYWEVCGR
ncbi:MAG: glycosyltransferase family 4 protein [Methylacidiphilales bacterium]|nr:glycosyltransferase family 4 protein [Candidatus Methylacidiphilales bacterium]